MSEDNQYKKALERERKARKLSEKILEEKSLQLYELNQKLEKLNTELEEVVIIRTLELQKQKEKAERLAQNKAAFLSMLSHEIKNPLNAIMGYIDLMDLSDGQDEKDLYIEKVQASSRILLGIVNDILMFSKAESSTLEVNLSEFNLLHEVTQMMTVVEQQVFGKDINFIVNCPDIVINTDKQKLSQVLINLLNNAVKFTNKGIIEMRVEYDENSSTLNCYVKDSGVGMSDEDCSKLFKPFVQVGKSKKSQKGTGLGLSICKKLVELLGGEISVTSKPNFGSQFHFYIKTA